MYKLALCWRYLLTRYLALACIISVMLGVATLIVVDSVMTGFSTKLKQGLRGMSSDLSVESKDVFAGMPDPVERMKLVRQNPYLDEQIVAMSPMIEVGAIIRFDYRGQPIMKQVKLIGIDPKERNKLGGFSQYLLDPANRADPSFELRGPARARYEVNQARLDAQLAQAEAEAKKHLNSLLPDGPPPPEPPTPTPEAPQGVIVGIAIASYREPSQKAGQQPEDRFLLEPGDDVMIITLSAEKLAPVYARFVVCDYFKSGMSEYDANLVFVPLDYLQKLRSMENRATSIQMKLKDYGQAAKVMDRLRQLRYADASSHSFPVFPEFACHISSWEEKQGPLLAAISIEKGLLNVLLFLIIAVAGFGILAIFSMIVTEKTRDIGIIKALGASNSGVMSIFLGYGLLLGLVGAGLGTGLGMVITINLNEIEKALTRLTGQQIFDRSIYYFSEIPTDIQFLPVLLVNMGAVSIAVLFSVLPALRAALLHPVRALRYE